MTTTRDGRWLAATLCVLAAWAAIRQALNPHITPDDAFFLDAGARWLASGRLTMGLWGDVYGHPNFLASYPPGPVIVASVDVWAMHMLHTVLAAKITGLFLLVATGAIVWRAFDAVSRPSVRAALLLAVLLDPCSTAAFFSLRPEALLLPLVLAVCLLLHGAVAGRPGARAWLVAATIALALTHWQFAPTVAFVVVALVVAARRSLVSMRFAAACAAAVTATYGAWLAVVLQSPLRVAAVRAQLLAPVGVATWLTRAKMLVGTVTVENLDAGSSAAVWLILAVIVLAVEWRRRTPGDPARHPAIALGFVLAAVAPAALLPYVGPRDVPIAFVTAWVIVDHIARGRAGSVIALAPIAAGLNVAGDIVLRARYLDQPWSQALATPSWIWVVVAVVIWQMGRRGVAVWGGRLALASILTAATVAAVASARPSGPRATDANVAATTAALAPVVRPGARVAGDATLHYLPIVALDRSTQALDLFPVFYASTADAAARVLQGLRADVILVSDRNAEQMVGVQPAGAVLARVLREEFVPRGDFTVDGFETHIFVRRTP